MALTVTHAYEATGADDPEAEINRAEWNAEHVIEGDYLRKATVTLPSADILDLHNTPVTLVAAPGAGKSLMVHRRRVRYTYGTTPYVTDDTWSLLRYTAGSAIGDAWDFLSAGFALLNDVSPDVQVDPANADEKAIELSTDGSVLSGGDGTLTVTVWYSIEDVP